MTDDQTTADDAGAAADAGGGEGAAASEADAGTAGGGDAAAEGERAEAVAGDGGAERGEGRTDREKTDDPRPAVAAEASGGRLLNGRYRLGSVVGRGGMGTVWEATDEVLGRSVAVKELRLPAGVDEAERRRMITRTMREAKAIATIRSRGVVTVYDVVDEGARPWIVMELIEGRSLADIIRRDGPMPPRKAARIGLDILDVLRAAHAAGIVHRDVKPSNVLVSAEDGRVVLTDFGIAKVEGDPSITSTGMLVGAPSYISPERARGQAPGPPADLWSLGALLYCCVEGRAPYDEGGAIATLAAVMHDPVTPPTQAGSLAEVINGLLVKDPEGRLDEPAARELLTAALREPDRSDDRTVVVGLAKLGRDPGEPATAVAPAVGPAGADDERRRRALIAAAVVVVLLAVLGTTLALTLGGDDDAGADDRSAGGEQTQDVGDDSADDPVDGPSGETDQDPDQGQGDDSADEPSTPAEEEGDGGAEEGDAPPGTSPETDPDAEPGGPAGYAEIVDEDFRFRISLPQGWERVGIAGQNSGGIYSASAGGLPKLQVDFTDSPGEDAEASWRELEPTVRRNSNDYELLGIETVSWRDYPTVADWEFERTENGERVRVLNRGFRVDDDHGYAIMITCAADAWDESGCETLRETAFQTFQPQD
ncbi:serine/threonine-protein kinase [Streptomyces hainanensis]|uniref:serine/threonine-protein kinase n=1 Tax=Streptomyces hainanensis TaxID=402648 RepID=UPI001FB6FA8B|nr:serine/threonine-protein kinase [Streptomyces hainanensis]